MQGNYTRFFFSSYFQDWSVKYEQDGLVQPRYDINAPDLYIPTMAYVTYVLVAGLVLGMQDRYVSLKIQVEPLSSLTSPT
jgi:hypothetical protein